MTQPTNNMSLKGICDWAEGNNGQRQNPPINQNINSDMVDGMHYTDLKADWEAYADTHGGGGGGVVAMGLANFAGNGGYVTIGAAQGMITMPDTNYLVYVVPSADTDSRVGEYWVPEANKSTTSFRVYNDGSATTQFRWAVATRASSTGTNSPAGGDLSGTYPDPTVAKIQGIPVSTTDPTAGQVLTYDGTSWIPAANSGSFIGAADLVLTTGSVDRTVNWQCPIGLSKIKIVVIGGGAGGGRISLDTGGGGGGGGGGGVAIHNSLDVVGGTVYTVYIGRGGPPDGNGGSSSLGSIIIASGGVTGGGKNSPLHNNGGAGGNGGGPAGSIIIAGGSGGNWGASGMSGGTGGGGGGSDGNGGNGSVGGGGGGGMPLWPGTTSGGSGAGYAKNGFRSDDGDGGSHTSSPTAHRAGAGGDFGGGGGGESDWSASGYGGSGAVVIRIDPSKPDFVA